MRILFTGGGTGGHFYPIIAVAEKTSEVISNRKILGAKLYFMSNSPYDKKALADNNIKYIYSPAGKLRIYFSLKTIIEVIKIGFGLITATVKMFFIYPDVIFSKGGYGSVPALFAARILRIPVIIHESDSFPGRVTLWSAKFAKKIAISYQEASVFFKEYEEKVAWTGQPIRKEILHPIKEGANEFLGLNKDIPTIFIIGGSTGAVTINDAVLNILPELLEKYQIIHQIGKNNVADVEMRLKVILEENPNKDRYKPMGWINPLTMKMSAGVADLVISRAGSTIFELATWGIPSIIIPIPEEISRDQKKNAFAYARAGGCIVLEQNNITPSVFLSTIESIIDNPEKSSELKLAAKRFARGEASQTIAEEIVDVAMSHYR